MPVCVPPPQPSHTGTRSSSTNRSARAPAQPNSTSSRAVLQKLRILLFDADTLFKEEKETKIPSKETSVYDSTSTTPLVHAHSNHHTRHPLTNTDIPDHIGSLIGRQNPKILLLAYAFLLAKGPFF
jgi:hypothetical protein